MKILFVLGGKVSVLHKENETEGISFYIKEQSEELIKNGVEVDYYRFNLSSKLNVISKIRGLKKVLKNNNYDLIHAHYGLFGFAAVLVKGKIPLVTTFHGSDINVKRNSYFSAIAAKFSSFSIFVSQALYNNSIVKPKSNFEIVPCGVDQSIFSPIEKADARDKLGYTKDGIYILFPSAMSNPIKNYGLARKALDLLDFEYELIELIKKSREEVNLIMNACDLLLLTSKSEGSPQVIKEALSVNLSIISVDVGDVSENIKNVKNCYIANNDPEDISIKINLVVSNNERTNGRINAAGFDNRIIGKKLIMIYQNLLEK